MWWQRGPAQCKRICLAACKFGSVNVASHSFASASSLFFTTSSTNCLEPTSVPKTFTPSGFQSSGPNCAIPLGHTDARFHTRVFPVSSWMPVCACNFSHRESYATRTRSGTGYVQDSEKVFVCSEFPLCLLPRVDRQAEQQRHQRVTLFAPFNLRMRWCTPSSSSQT